MFPWTYFTGFLRSISLHHFVFPLKSLDKLRNEPLKYVHGKLFTVFLRTHLLHKLLSHFFRRACKHVAQKSLDKLRNVPHKILFVPGMSFFIYLFIYLFIFIFNRSNLITTLDVNFMPKCIMIWHKFIYSPNAPSLFSFVGTVRFVRWCSEQSNRN